MHANYLFSLDVGHPPRPPQKVEQELDAAWSKVRNSSTLRVIKVIHGYGSHGKGGSTRETVRNWAFQFRRRFRATINGEDYNMFDDDTQELREECGQIADNDFGNGNAGMTLIWVK